MKWGFVTHLKRWIFWWMNLKSQIPTSYIRPIQAYKCWAFKQSALIQHFLLHFKSMLSNETRLWWGRRDSSILLKKFVNRLAITTSVVNEPKLGWTLTPVAIGFSSQGGFLAQLAHLTCRQGFESRRCVVCEQRQSIKSTNYLYLLIDMTGSSRLGVLPASAANNVNSTWLEISK